MKAENKRIMITIPPDLEAEIQSLKKEKFYAEFLNLPVDNMSLGSTSRLPLTALTAGPASAQDMPPEIGQA